MHLREEERANRGNKRVLPEIEVSEWEITCKETSKATQTPVGETPSQATRLRRKKKKRLRLIKKGQQQISKPGDLPPR
jgi:P pilus assembly chaperone PapD